MQLMTKRKVEHKTESKNVYKDFTKKAVKKYFAYTGLILLSTVLSLCSIELVRDVLRVIENTNSKNILSYVLLLIVVVLCNFAISILNDFYSISQEVKDLNENQSIVFKKILHSRETYNMVLSDDDIMIIVTRTVSAFTLKLHEIIRSVISSIIILVLTMVYLVKLNTFLVLICMVYIVFIPVFQKLVENNVRNYSLLMEESNSNCYAFINSVVENIVIIKIMNLFESVTFKINEYFGIYTRVIKKIGIYKKIEENLQFIITLIGTCLVLSCGSFLVIQGSIKISILISFIIAFEMIISPVVALAGVGISIAESKGMFERIKTVLMLQVDNQPIGNAIKIQNLKIQLSNLEYTVGERIIRYKDVVLRFENGHGLVIIRGKNGSGKTCLLRLLLKLDLPNKGDIKINDIKLCNLNTEYWHNSIAYAPQKPVFHNGRIIDDILYGMSGNEYDKNTLDHYISKLEIKEDIIQKKIGVDNKELSEGEKQKVNLLRAFVRSAPIVFLDEPYTSLDQKTRKLLTLLINEESKKRLVFIIMHENNNIFPEKTVYFVDE